MNKINEIKLALTQVKTNFEKEAAHAVTDEMVDEVPIFTLA